MLRAGQLQDTGNDLPPYSWRHIRQDDDIPRTFSGLDPLDCWLRDKAAKRHKAMDSRVHVAARDDTNEIIAFYALRLGSERSNNIHGEHKGKADTLAVNGVLPCISLEWLGVKKSYQRAKNHNYRLGEACLSEALFACADVLDRIGGYALIVTAVEGARGFYEKYGFLPCGRNDADRLLLPARTISEFRDSVG